MIEFAIFCLLAVALYKVAKPLFCEECPMCDGRNTEECVLLYPANHKSYLCHDCKMWFSKKNSK